MKKVLLFAIIIISLQVSAQISDTAFEKGYSIGYSSITKERPNIIPIDNNWTLSTFNNNFNRSDQNKQMMEEKNIANLAFSRGYDRGKEEGRKFLQEKARKEKQLQICSNGNSN